MNGSISPKVANGAGAGGLSGSLSVVLIWALGHWVTVPPEIATAIAAIIVTSLSYLAGYYTPHESATSVPPPQVVIPRQAPPPQQPQQGPAA